MSTPETVEGFSNALTGCTKHQVGAWAILYTLVKVRGSCELLMVVKGHLVHSRSILKHAI